jgi:hypothetical protein
MPLIHTFYLHLFYFFLLVTLLTDKAQVSETSLTEFQKKSMSNVQTDG